MCAGVVVWVLVCVWVWVWVWVGGVGERPEKPLGQVLADRQPTLSLCPPPPTHSPSPLSLSRLNIGASASNLQTDTLNPNPYPPPCDRFLKALQEAKFPSLELPATHLVDPEHDHGRLLYVAHLMLHQPAMRPAKLEALKREVEHMQASFHKLRESKTLYVDGLHPLCRGLILMHNRFRREHAQVPILARRFGGSRC